MGVESYPLHHPLDNTPPFLVWSLEHTCALREFTSSAPHATERLLRGVKCYRQALLEQRVLGDVVVQPDWEQATAPVGFSVTSVLEPLGGLASIQGACSDCPANAALLEQPTALAGCMSFFSPRHSNLQPLHAYLRSVLATADLLPTWYAFANAPYNSKQGLENMHVGLLRLIAAEGNSWFYGLTEFQLAIHTALEKNLPLLVEAHAAGVCSGRTWEVAAHCSRCTAPWPNAKVQQCAACGGLGQRQQTRSRKRMGTRPYRLLSEFLTPAAIEELRASQ